MENYAMPMDLATSFDMSAPFDFSDINIDLANQVEFSDISNEMSSSEYEKLSSDISSDFSTDEGESDFSNNNISQKVRIKDEEFLANAVESEDEYMTSVEEEIPKIQTRGRRRAPAPVKKVQRKRKAEQVEEEEAEGTLHYNPSNNDKSNAFAFDKASVRIMSIADLEGYAKEVAEHHVYSSEEKALLKKYRRQIRNRNSAQNSRARKRALIDNLEEKNKDLRSENNNLESQIDEQERTILQLQERVSYLEKVAKDNNIKVEPAVKVEARKNKKQRGRRAATMLFMVIFSFGLFMGGNYMPNMYNTNQPPFLQNQPAFQTRELLNVPTMRTLSTESVKPRLMIQPRQAEVEFVRDTVVDPKDFAEKSRYGLVPASPYMRIHTEPEGFNTWSKPNTEYLYCPAATYIASSKNNVGDIPTKISLVVPTNTLNISANAFGGKMPAFVEMTCSVVDVYPLMSGNSFGNPSLLGK